MTAIVLKYPRYVPPTASQFGTAVGTNSESPTLADNADRGLTFAYGSTPATGDNVRYVAKTKPTASNYDIIARLRASPLGFDNYSYGLVLTDGTKIILFGTAQAPQGNLDYRMRFVNQWWNTTTSFSADKLDTANYDMDVCEWYRIGVVSGVPTDYYVSHNGADWVKLLSQAATGFLTFTQIGFGMYANRSGGLRPVASTPQCFMNILYWSDADITPSV